MSRDYYQSEEFKEILANYESSKDKDESLYLDAEDFADIADYYLYVDKPQSAMSAVDMGLAVHPDEDVLLVMRSAVCIYLRQFDEAEEILNGLDAANIDVMYQQAQLQYAKYDNIEKAEEIWRKWMEGDGDSEKTGDALKRENYIHIISSLAELRPINQPGEEEKDRETVTRWIQEYIELFQPLGKFNEDVQLADICRDCNLTEQMSVVLTQVLEEQPYLPKGWSNLALAQFLQKRNEQAIESCDFALAIDPNDLDALLTKAHALNAMGEKSASGPVFKEYLDKGGEVVQKIPYAEALFLDGEKDAAKQQLEDLALFVRNERRQKAEEWEELRKKLPAAFLDMCDEEEHDYLDLVSKIFSDIGDLYHHNGLFQESLDAYTEVVSADPHCAEAYFMLGVNNLALSQYDDSSREFAKALKYAEDQVMMGVDIALTFVLNNFEDFALEVLNAVTQIAPTSSSPFVKNIPAAKSLTYLKMGHTDQFLKYFKQACDNTPELVKKVYGSLFPADLPVPKWYGYAEKEIDELVKKFKKEDLYIGGFS